METELTRWERLRRLHRRTRAMPFKVEEATRVAEANREVLNHLVQREAGGTHEANAVAERLDALAHSLAAIHHDLAVLRDTTHAGLDDLHHGLAAVAEQVAWIDAPAPDDSGPTVSVICALHNRAALVERSLASMRAQTYPNWEFLVVDDGSDDLDESTIERWQRDRRIRVFRQAHSGEAAARNHGLSEATGSIVAYLDSDNTYHPTNLAWVVATMEADNDVEWTVASQLVDDGRRVTLRPDRYDAEFLRTSNYLDVNAVAHRRTLLDRIPGPPGFDESRERLADWELFQRMASVAGTPTRIAAVGSIYDGHRPDRVSRMVPLHPSLARLRRRGQSPVADGLRVLVATSHYPQVTETYLRADTVGLVAQGAHVEVWSEQDVAVSYDSTVPWRRGSLDDAITAVQPDIVLTYRLNVGRTHADTVHAGGIPMAVRGHGVDFDPDSVDALLAQPGVGVHLFPNLHARYGKDHPRLRPLSVAFDQDLFPPSRDKDRSLVVRTGAGLLTKDYETFFAVARMCPDHRFVLVLGTSFRAQEQTGQIIDLARSVDAPVEIVTDLDPTDAAEIVREAGIYLHCHSSALPFGMSVSIAEAMGAGCYVLARDLPGAGDYLSDGGDVYRDADHAAALIQQTSHWGDHRWADTWRAASDSAHTRFGAVDVAATMVEQWRETLGVVASSA